VTYVFLLAAVLIFKSRNHHYVAQSQSDLIFPRLRLRLIVFGSTMCGKEGCNKKGQSEWKSIEGKLYCTKKCLNLAKAVRSEEAKAMRVSSKFVPYSFSLTCPVNLTTLFLLSFFSLYPTEAEERQVQCHQQSHQQSHQQCQDVRGTRGYENGRKRQADRRWLSHGPQPHA